MGNKYLKVNFIHFINYKIIQLSDLCNTTFWSLLYRYKLIHNYRLMVSFVFLNHQIIVKNITHRSNKI